VKICARTARYRAARRVVRENNGSAERWPDADILPIRTSSFNAMPRHHRH